MNTKSILKIRWRAVLPAVLLALSTAAFVSCNKEETTGEAYLNLSGGKDFYEYDAKAHSATMEIRSNMGKWTIEPEFTEDLEWIDVWPFEGTNDGRFTMNILENTTAFTRFANINVVVDGAVVTSFKVSQGASDPYLSLGLGGSTMTSPSRASELTIPLNTNVGWKAELVSPVTWIRFGSETEDTQTISVSENTEVSERTADIKFTAIGTGLEELSVTVTIKQFDRSKDPYNGQKKTVAEILQLLGNAPGKITENYYVDVFVTSDIDKLNVLPNQMFVQDDSGRGMLVEFASAGENIFPLNSKLSIHLYDSEFVTSAEAEDPVGRGLKLVNFAGNQVFENNGVDAVGAVPVEVGSLRLLADNLAGYENTLVRLPLVEFGLPFGCYVNIDEGNSKTIGFNELIDNTNDGPTLYGQLIRDASGKAVKVLSRRLFLDRFSQTMPKGSGSITGIVAKHAKDGAVEPAIYIRNKGDNKVSDSEADRITNTLVNFGPLVDRPDLPKIMSSVGTAQLKTSCYEAVVKQSGAAIQYAYTYARREPGTITVNPISGEQTALPVLVNTPMETAIKHQYTCYNQSTFFDFAGSTINREGLDADDKHEAWIVNVDEFAPSGGDLYLMLTASGSYRSPMNYILEWADQESAPATSYNEITRFTISYWSYSYQLQQISLALPDVLKGKHKFTLRMRGTGSQGAGGADINNSAAVRIGMLRIVEMK